MPKNSTHYRQSSRRRIINTCIREVARKLGNTTSTCRKYYVHPAVLAAFERGLLAEIFERASRTGSTPRTLSTEEAAVLFMLENGWKKDPGLGLNLGS